MRFYDLLNLQHVIIYVFPTLTFIVIFGLALAYSHFRTRSTVQRIEQIHYTFPEGVEDREEPFPVCLILIIAGTVVWGFFYILFTGLLGVKI